MAAFSCSLPIFSLFLFYGEMEEPPEYDGKKLKV